MGTIMWNLFTWYRKCFTAIYRVWKHHRTTGEAGQHFGVVFILDKSVSFPPAPYHRYDQPRFGRSTRVTTTCD